PGAAAPRTVLLQSLAELERRDPADARKARQEEDDERSRETRGGDERETELDAAPLGRRCGNRSRGRQRSRVQQPDDDDRQADRAEACRLSRQAAYDGDADHFIEASRQRNAADRRGAARWRERQGL